MTSPLNITTAVVYDKTSHYYAIGNSPPTQLIPRGILHPQILCLAAGDLRSIFFSVSRSDAFDEGGSEVRAHFVINDISPFVIARNVLLLALALQPEDGDALQLWALWHSLSLTTKQWARVREVLRELLDGASILGLTQFRGDTLQQCRRVWEQWLSWNFTPTEAETMRDKYLCARNKCSRTELDVKFREQTQVSFVREGYFGGALTYTNHPPVHLPGLHVQEDRLRSVILTPGLLDATGLTGKLDEGGEVNRTLFTAPDHYSLHYSTKFFEGFPLWHFGMRDETLLEHCQSQLAEWTRDLRTRCNSLQFTFATGDCLSLCMTSPDWLARFDVIDTSNVCDHIGLAPVLLSCRNVVSPTGVLQTSSMTFTSNYGEFAGKTEYLQALLCAEPRQWPDVYGWSCDGQDPSSKMILHVEWPLVSPKGRINFRWRPTKCRHARHGCNEATLTRLVSTLMVECEQLQSGAGLAHDRLVTVQRQIHLHYSVGAVLLLLLRNTPSPLDFVRTQDAVPTIFRAELETWLTLLTAVPSSNAPSRPSAQVATSLAISPPSMAMPESSSQGSAVWVEIDIADGGNALFEHNAQPWLRVFAMCGGQPASFSCLALGATVLGHTFRASFLAPPQIDFATVELHDFNGMGGRVRHSEARGSSTSLPDMEALLTVVSAQSTSAVPPSVLHADSAEAGVVLVGVVTCGAKSPRRHHGPMETAAYLRASTGMMLKSEMLLSRSVGPGTDVSHEDPLLELKELVLAFFGTGKRRYIVCAGDGAGAVPLVIVMESVCQDEISGVPLADLVIFQPFSPFSLNRVPRELEDHHAEDDAISKVEFLSRKARGLLVQIVRLLGAEPRKTERMWGMAGTVAHVLLPPLFPCRAAKMREVMTQINLEVELEILSIGPARAVEKMTALKDRGNVLLAKGRFADAVFVYMLGALKIEDGGVDDADPGVRTVAAQCHCNIAFAKLHIGGSEAIVDAERSCSVAIVLQPSWAKPYYRRGLCREQRGMLKSAMADLRKASRLSPNDRTIAGALLRLSHSPPP